MHKSEALDGEPQPGLSNSFVAFSFSGTISVYVEWLSENVSFERCALGLWSHALDGHAKISLEFDDRRSAHLCRCAEDRHAESSGARCGVQGIGARILTISSLTATRNVPRWRCLRLRQPGHISVSTSGDPWNARTVARAL